MSSNRNQTDRLIFNGHNLSALVSCEIQRPILAPIEIKTLAIPGRTDELVRSVKRLPYDLPVKVHLRSENRYDIKDVRRKLAEMLWTDEPKPLYLPDDPTRYLLAIVTGNTMLDELDDDSPEATITFRIVDPDFFGKNRKVMFSVSDAASEIRINTGGNLPSYPIITFSITSEVPVIDVSCRKYDNAGYFLESSEVAIPGPFERGRKVEIDMKNEGAFSNGKRLETELQSSDFFALSGNVELIFYRLGLNGAYDACVEWRERWL